MILAVCQLDWCIVTLIVKVIGRAAELMYYYFNSSFGGFIRAYGNLNWVTKEPELIPCNLISAQTQGCLIQKEKAHVKAFQRFQMWRQVSTWHEKSHPWHNLPGKVMKWPLHTVTALLLACSSHFFLPIHSLPEGESPAGQGQHLWNNQDTAEQIKTNVFKEMWALPLEICNWIFQMQSMPPFPKLWTLFVWWHGKRYSSNISPQMPESNPILVLGKSNSPVENSTEAAMH